VAGLGGLFSCGTPFLDGRWTKGGGTIIDPHTGPHKTTYYALHARSSANVGQLRPTFYAVNARYNALEAQIRKTLSHGLQLQGSYTWSKCYDNSSSGDTVRPHTNSLSRSTSSHTL